MSEMEAIHYCEQCRSDTDHIFSGSGTKGVCMCCGNHLPPEERANLANVLSYSG